MYCENIIVGEQFLLQSYKGINEGSLKLILSCLHYLICSEIFITSFETSNKLLIHIKVEKSFILKL